MKLNEEQLNNIKSVGTLMLATASKDGKTHCTRTQKKMKTFLFMFLNKIKTILNGAHNIKQIVKLKYKQQVSYLMKLNIMKKQKFYQKDFM